MNTDLITDGEDVREVNDRGLCKVELSTGVCPVPAAGSSM